LGSDWPSVSPFMAAKAGAVKQLRVCNIAPEAKVRCLYWLGNCLQTHQTCTLFRLPFAMAPSTKSLITERLCTLKPLRSARFQILIEPQSNDTPPRTTPSAAFSQISVPAVGSSAR
jgi:hypothetical protein